MVVHFFSRDWTEAERAELDRLRVRFPEPTFEIECSCTDQGEPWCSVHDIPHDIIVVHIARIGRLYMVAWPGDRIAQVPTIERAVNMALRR